MSKEEIIVKRVHEGIMIEFMEDKTRFAWIIEHDDHAHKLAMDIMFLLGAVSKN